MLKLGFLRSGTLYPIFVLKDRCFFYATSLKICFTEAPPIFYQKRNVLRELRTPQGFRHYATYRRQSKILSKKFFLNFLFFKGFPLRKMVFLLFSVGEEWFSRLSAYPFGYFGTVYCKIHEILMSFYPWFSL